MRLCRKSDVQNEVLGMSSGLPFHNQTLYTVISLYPGKGNHGAHHC
ncbi:hypothetical protein C8R21_106113 [Nitrosospira multiformis]|jgi:hypothetical protein|uniref:Uncharacterized protein n=1 Tax=Nitrosospira multiformis TaxID=1231 RepID=A0A1I7I1G4_9PROT|nr:hypothetical protein C8R21_106113 [Nitrosospira multiformis]SFU66586.1 hypothetical protein SAMN05216417_11368 [Nitrosospira multiformis]